MRADTGLADVDAAEEEVIEDSRLKVLPPFQNHVCVCAHLSSMQTRIRVCFHITIRNSQTMHYYDFTTFSMRVLRMIGKRTRSDDWDGLRV